MGVDRPIDVTADQRKTLLALLKRHLPNTTAWAYGSRVKWTARPQSDLDLVVFTKPDQERRVSELREAFEESNLPFRVDLFAWDAVPEQFRKEIEAEHVVLVDKEEQGVGGDGWVSLRLGDVCTKIGSGATPRGGKEVYLQDGPCTLIRSQNVYNNRFNHDGLAFIDQQQATELNNVEVFADDVLLNITGDSVARACQVARDVLPARVNQHVAIIRPDPNKLSPRFLRYFLVCPEIQSMLLSWAGSGGTRDALTKGMIESFDVQAPMDVAEQRAIAHILGTLDDKIELNRRMNETLEAMARALFKSWFIDFDPVRAKAALRNQEGGDWTVERAYAYLDNMDEEIAALFPDRLVDSELGPIPEGWEVGCLADIAAAPQRGVGPAGLRGETPYIGLEHMPRHSIALNEWEGADKVTSNKLAFRKGEFLFGKLRPYFHKVGIAPVSGVCSTDIVVIAPKIVEWFSFVLACVSSTEFVAYTDQTSTGTKMPRTSWKTMSGYRLCLPSSSVVRAFQNVAQPSLDRIIANISQSGTLAALRDALLPKLISGQIRIHKTEIQMETIV